MMGSEKGNYIIDGKLGQALNTGDAKKTGGVMRGGRTHPAGLYPGGTGARSMPSPASRKPA